MAKVTDQKQPRKVAPISPLEAEKKAEKSMKRIVFRCIMVASTANSTLSRLWVSFVDESGEEESRGLCWILEDGYRAVKERGQTRIPDELMFPVKPTRQSKFYAPYKANPILRAKYVISLEEVPNFSLIRVHLGVNVENTDGCPLTGLSCGQDAKGNFTISRSAEALERLYDILDPYFDEKAMDFTVPVFWIAHRVPLLQLATS